MLLQRRTFLLGALCSGIAPLVCKAENLMRLRGEPTQIVRTGWFKPYYLNNEMVKDQVFDSVEQIAHEQLRAAGLEPLNLQYAVNELVDASLYCSDKASTIEEMQLVIRREGIANWPRKMRWDVWPRDVPARRIAEITRYVDVVG